MNKTFYNINTISHYSLLSSSLSLDDIIFFAKKNNQTHVVLTDWNLMGCYEFYFKAKQNELTPVIGLNYLYKNSHYLFIAKNNQGFHNLLKLNSKTNLNKEFNINDLINDCYVIHISGEHHLKSNNYYSHKELAYNLANTLNEQDFIIINILEAIKDERKLKEIENNQSHYLINTEKAMQLFDKKQIELTHDLIVSCNWILEPIKPRLAKFSNKNNFNSKTYLYEQCIEGLKNKVSNNKQTVAKKYVERLNYELSVIDEMGYNDYFLIVADFVNYAKNNDILVGPGRGSAAGSLVSYCLNITDVDPIKYNLIFERFLNISRKSLPDIDIDIMDTRRQEVIDYIFDKYGPDKTSYIMTLQRIKAKMAIRDVGRILDIDLKIIDKITKLISSEQEENLKLCYDDDKFKIFIKEYPDLFEYANKIINIPRQVSTHAAGIIISDKSLDEYIPVQTGIDQWQLTGVTMDYLETLGLFKMDILGLRNLSIINDVLELIKINKSVNVDLSKIDLDDQKLFDDLSSGNTIGIFQLESPGMRNTIMKIKPKSVEDISICSALFRPGPQSLIPEFVKTREKKIEPKYLNEDLKKTFEPTLGFCIYQEQVIELIRSVTNFSLAEADIFRRAISKKQEELFIKMKESFNKAAQANGYSLSESNKIYDFILEFANYGFNHSHSLAYSFISYQMMYLKYYYPLEFYLVLLIHGDSTKNNLYISQAKKKMIKIYNVSILNSQISFSIFNNGIMFGFSNIKGIGNEIAKKIIAIREQYKFQSWNEAISILSRQSINRKTIELLIKVGAFEEFEVDRNFLLLNLEEIISKSSISIENHNVFDINISNDYIPMSEIEKAQYEYELLSYTFSNDQFNNVFDKYKAQYELKKLNDTDSTNQSNNLIYIKNLKERMTKYAKKMCFIEFSESDVDFSCASFSENIFSKLNVNEYAVVKLKKTNDNKIQLADVIATFKE